MCFAAGWNIFAGRIWPASRRVENPDKDYEEVWLQHTQGIRRRAKGHNSQGAEWVRRPQKSPTMPQILSSIQYICFRQASGSNMGDPNLLLTRAASTSLCPWVHNIVGVQHQRWTVLIYSVDRDTIFWAGIQLSYLTASKRHPSTPYSRNAPQSFSQGTRPYTFPRSTKRVYTSLACSQDFLKICWNWKFVL